MDSSDSQFIFKESEFEDGSFLAAHFVAKYRKVSSLEALKEQLLQYSNSLKQQLYDIINRDYKDFITISTKLDGVDTRTLLLQKPLLEIRSDVAALHEGVVTGMQAIQEKVKHRLAVAGRRRLMETLLQCMDRLDATQAILSNSIHSAGHGTEGGLGDLLSGGSSGPPSSSAAAGPASSQRSRLLKAMDRKLALAASAAPVGDGAMLPGRGAAAVATSTLLLEKDVFICSELERASFCLAAVDTALQALWQQFAEQQESAESDDGDAKQVTSAAAGASPVLAQLQSRSGLLSLLRTLEAQAKAHRETLVGRIHSQLTHLLTNCLGGIAGSTSNSTDTAATGPSPTADSTIRSSSSASRTPGALKSRSFAHCLRALCSLGRPEVAEELIRSSVVAPFIRSHLTVGRVDGRGGRGSYSGLEDALQTVLDTLSLVTGAASDSATAAAGGSAPSFLITCLRVGETVLSYCDETAAAVTPAAGTQATDGPESSAPHCRKLDLVVEGVWRPLAELMQERFADMFSVGIPATLSHCYRCMRAFLQKLQGMCGPTYASALASRLETHPLITSFFAQWKLDLYFQLRCKEAFVRLDRACEATLRQGLTAPQALLDELYPRSASGAPDSLHQTLRPEVETQLTHCGGLTVPLFSAAALELRSFLHPTVFLDPLANKFLALILRTLMRIEAHVAVSVNITTPSFPTREEVDQLRAVSGGSGDAQQAAAATPSAASASSTATPGAAKRTTQASTPSGASSDVTAGLPVLALEELVLLSGDLLCLETWVTGEFSTATASALVLRGKPAWSPTDSSGAVDLRAVDAVRAVLVAQVKKLRTARSEVWARMTALLGGECKKALGAVKSAVVSKYRMTNKPAPETPSAYVETILAPLRKFLGRFSVVVRRVLSATAAGAPAEEALAAWQRALVEDVSSSFSEQVSALIETVKQMDSTLQRRSKLQQTSAASAAAMSDSEKIALQIKLDIEAYGRDIQSFGLDLSQLQAFCTLKELSFENV